MLAIRPTYNRSTKTYDVEMETIHCLCGLEPRTWYFNNVDQAIGRLTRFPEIMPKPEMRDAVMDKLAAIR